ncbi:MAG TPA: TetR family transcriptional regulator [Kribbella sp.]
MSGQKSWPAPPLSGAGRAQRPQKRSGRRRLEILEAAMAVFGERGYANGSLQEIADRVGMTHAGVLHHFGSKEQLLIALLEYRDDADVAELEGHHAPRGAPLLEHLVNTAEENAKRAGIVQAYTVLLGEAVTDNHPGRKFFTDRFAGLRDMVASAVADATGRPLDDPKVSAGASAIIAVMDGLQSQWLLDPDAVDMRATVDLAIRSLVRELS